MLSALMEAAEQVPPSPKLMRAVQAARKAVQRNPASVKAQDYSLVLGNTARALECIAEGLRWAGEMKSKQAPLGKIMPVIIEQNKRACRAA
jgi:hypothetical protein